MTGSLKRRQPLNLMALNRDKKIGCSDAEESPSTRLIKSQTMTTTTTSFPQCCQVPYLLLLKQLGWRIRSRWRHFLIRRRRFRAAAANGIRLNYDLRSYAQNFDDGRLSVHDSRSPLAP